jgi:hypothetical protein
MSTGGGPLTDRNVLIAIAVATLLIGFRTVSVAVATAREAARDVSEGTTPLGRGSRLVEAVARQDSILGARSRVARNPFGPPPSEGPARVVAKTPDVKPIVPPIVRLLAVETSRKVTVLEVEGELSGNLQEGSAFRGWTVTEITSALVRVEKDGKTYTLPKP